MKNITHQSSRNALVTAIKLLLRPLVRLLIHHQLTFPLVRELLKEVYVDVAREMINQDGGGINDSRIFILSGVHRKDLKRLREQDESERSASSSLSLGGSLIARWTALPEFLDENGAPRALPKSGSQQQPGFDQLVIALSKDIRPRAILDEWLRQGIVSLEDDCVVLNQAAFVPAHDFDQLCYYLGQHTHDHLASSVHNLLEEGEPMLERSVYYAHLSEDSVQKLRQSASTQSIKLLAAINQQAMALYQQDQSSPQATHRFRLGCYWYQQDNNS